MEAVVVDEPLIVVFKGSFKLAAEPRGVARSAALAAAEMVLVSLRRNSQQPLNSRHGRHAQSSRASSVTAAANMPGLEYPLLSSHIDSTKGIVIGAAENLQM